MKTKFLSEEDFYIKNEIQSRQDKRQIYESALKNCKTDKQLAVFNLRMLTTGYPAYANLIPENVTFKL